MDTDIASDNEVIMYARQTYCPDVNRARRRLKHHGVSWIEYDIEADGDARNRMFEITGRGSVPTLLIGDRVLIEPAVEEIDEALEAASLLVSPTQASR